MIPTILLNVFAIFQTMEKNDSIYIELDSCKIPGGGTYKLSIEKTSEKSMPMCRKSANKSTRKDIDKTVEMLEISKLKEKISKEYDVVIEILKKQKEEGIRTIIAKELKARKKNMPVDEDGVNAVVQAGHVIGDITIYTRDIN